MSAALIECVPNFSEGRDRAAMAEIVAAMERVSAASVLAWESDPDHNRSVVTLAGAPGAILEAALAGVGKAAQLIDLNHHEGVHPRIGATDVLPFVPLEHTSMQECAALAWQAGETIWQRFGIPVYFYEAAARMPHRKRLELVRGRGLEELRAQLIVDAARAPDIGTGLHPTAGAIAVGARNILIAFNVNFLSDDVAAARRIARAVRESSGGLPFVKAMGVFLQSRNMVQVSMNLTDFERTPIHSVLDAIGREAEVEGLSIAGTELVGLMPRRAVEMAAAHYLRCDKIAAGGVLENRLK